MEKLSAYRMGIHCATVEGVRSKRTGSLGEREKRERGLVAPMEITQQKFNATEKTERITICFVGEARTSHKAKYYANFVMKHAYIIGRLAHYQRTRHYVAITKRIDIERQEL